MTLSAMAMAQSSKRAGRREIYRSIETLLPFANNARTHSDAQVAEIAAPIREFGWTNPVLVDEEGGIIAGHGRVRAAALLGLAEVPTLLITGLSQAQKRALVIADNRIAENAGWDEALLKLELEALHDEEGLDLSLLGFDDAALVDLLGFASGGKLTGDPDAAPPVPERAVSELGDVWILGSHRVTCGDSTAPASLARLMGDGVLARLVWTDPPYNVAYSTAAGSIANDDMKDDAFRAFLLALFTAAAGAMEAGASIYVAHADTEGLNFRAAFAEAGFKLSSCVIWRKDSMVLGRSDYQWAHEPILYGWKLGKPHRWYGGRRQTTVAAIGGELGFQELPDGRWQIQIGDDVLVVEGGAKAELFPMSVMFNAKPRRSEDHPTMKPVELIERHLKNSARPGDIVLDVCGGSGSTLIAAHRLGMRARLCELDPRYVDVIVRRWQELTGETATLESTGKTFAATATRRARGKRGAG